jgi:hypothetical protein
LKLYNYFIIVIEFKFLKYNRKMKISDIIIFTLYGLAFSAIIIYIVGLFYQPQQTIIYNEETPVVTYQEPIYPWYSPYNWYYTWAPFNYWSGSGYDGGYGRRWGSGRRWGGGGHRPYGGIGRGANVGAPRGGFGGGARGGGGRGGMRGGGGGRR